LKIRNFSNIIKVTFGCLAYSANSLDSGGFQTRPSASALALGAPNVAGREFRAPKCQRADYGIYKAAGSLEE
jgi:hypothetical protein